MTDDKALELYEKCDRELPNRGDLGSFKRLIGTFARALLTTPPAAALAPVVTEFAGYLYTIENELRPHDPIVRFRRKKLSEAQLADPIIKTIEVRELYFAAPTPSTPAPLVFDDWFELYMADKAEADRDLERRAAIAGWIAAHEHWSKSSTPAPVAEYIATLPADWHVDSSFETWFPLTAEELESTKRMFLEACSDLGLISEKLGIDPDEAGGAGPILGAIEELKCAAPPTRPDVGDARDAARYRWLRDQNKRMHYTTDYQTEGTVDLIQIEVTVDGEPLFTPAGHFDFSLELDRAVDAAMLAPQSSEKEDQVIAAKQQGDA